MGHGDVAHVEMDARTGTELHRVGNDLGWLLLLFLLVLGAKLRFDAAWFRPKTKQRREPETNGTTDGIASNAVVRKRSGGGHRGAENHSARDRNLSLEALREAVKIDGGLPASVVVAGDVDGTLTRFLEANHWKVDEAHAALQSMMRWREENKIDLLLSKPSNVLLQRSLCQFCPSSHHGFDKAGHPIHVELSGKYKWRQLFKICGEDELLQTHLKMMEYQQRVLFSEATARAGRLIDKMCNIVDVSGLSLKSISPQALEIFKRVQKMDQQMYPETLAVTYVMNAPWAFRCIWKLIKVCLPQRERAKVRVLPGGKKGLEELKKYVDEEFIPVQVGGSCRTCGGECVSGPTGSGEKPTLHMKIMMEDIKQAVWKTAEADMVRRSPFIKGSEDADNET